MGGYAIKMCVNGPNSASEYVLIPLRGFVIVCVVQPGVVYNGNGHPWPPIGSTAASQS